MYRAAEDGRALLEAAQEIHAERHGHGRFHPGPSYLFWKRQNAPASARTVSATTMP
jgi:hypothetical protein